MAHSVGARAFSATHPPLLIAPFDIATLQPLSFTSSASDLVDMVVKKCDMLSRFTMRIHRRHVHARGTAATRAKVEVGRRGKAPPAREFVLAHDPEISLIFWVFLRD